MNLAAAALLSPPQNHLFREKLAAFRDEYMWTADGEPDLVYMCGLPALDLLDRYLPLAAPLLGAARYQARPWYFVDVVGRSGHADATRWAYNHKASFSGWRAVHFGLRLEHRAPENIEWIESGSHEASWWMVREGKVDRAAIDSMFLDLQPGVLDGLEVVNTWGPWPAPPVMAARHLTLPVLDKLRSQFQSAEGGEWLLLDEDHLDPIAAVVADSGPS